MIIFIKDVPWYFNFCTKKRVSFFFSLFFFLHFLFLFSPLRLSPDIKTIGEVEVNIIPHLHVILITNQTDKELILKKIRET